MSELLNSVITTETITEYDRSHGGSFENPYGGAPTITFNMHRIKVNSGEELISSKSLPNVVEPYAPGKVYKLFNPSTGAEVVGVTFTSDQLYAMIYSTMIRAIKYRDLSAAAVAADQLVAVDELAVTAALAMKNNADANVIIADSALQENPSDQNLIDAQAAAVVIATTAAANLASAQSTLAVDQAAASAAHAAVAAI